MQGSSITRGLKGPRSDHKRYKEIHHLLYLSIYLSIYPEGWITDEAAFAGGASRKRIMPSQKPRNNHIHREKTCLRDSSFTSQNWPVKQNAHKAHTHTYVPEIKTQKAKGKSKVCMQQIRQNYEQRSWMMSSPCGVLHLHSDWQYYETKVCFYQGRYQARSIVNSSHARYAPSWHFSALARLVSRVASPPNPLFPSSPHSVL